MKLIKALIVFTLLASFGVQAYEWNTDTHLPISGDFNGDGRTDLLLQAQNENGQTFISFSFHEEGLRFDDFLLDPDDVGVKVSQDKSRILVADVNADGFDDILVLRNSKEKVHVLLSRTKRPNRNPTRQYRIRKHYRFGLEDLEPGLKLRDYEAHLGDLNGDNRTDLILQPKASGSKALAVLSDEDAKFGKSGTKELKFGINLAADRKILHIADFNGDLRDDILVQRIRGNDKKHHLVLIKNRINRSQPIEIDDDFLNLIWHADTTQISLADFDQNGLADLVFSREQIIDPNYTGPQIALGYLKNQGQLNGADTMPVFQRCDFSNFQGIANQGMITCVNPPEQQQSAAGKSQFSVSKTTKNQSSIAFSAKMFGSGSTTGTISASPTSCEVPFGQTYCDAVTITAAVDNPTPFASASSNCLFRSTVPLTALACGQSISYPINDIALPGETFYYRATSSPYSQILDQTTVVATTAQQAAPNTPGTPFFQQVEVSSQTPPLDIGGVFSLCWQKNLDGTLPEYYEWSYRVDGVWSSPTTATASGDSNSVQCASESQQPHVTDTKIYEYQVKACVAGSCSLPTPLSPIAVRSVSIPVLGGLALAGVEHPDIDGRQVDGDGVFTVSWDPTSLPGNPSGVWFHVWYDTTGPIRHEMTTDGQQIVVVPTLPSRQQGIVTVRACPTQVACDDTTGLAKATIQLDIAENSVPIAPVGLAINPLRSSDPNVADQENLSFSWQAVPMATYDWELLENGTIRGSEQGLTLNEDSLLIFQGGVARNLTFKVRATNLAGPSADSIISFILIPGGGALQAVENINPIWTNEASGLFQVSWSYPADSFNTANGKPDTFELQNVFSDTPVVIPAGNVWQSTWQLDAPIGVASGGTYTLKACKNSGECESSMFTILRSPDSNLPQVEWQEGNPASTVSGDAFTLSWIPVNHPDVDYYQIREFFDSQTERVTLNDQTVVYYTEKPYMEFTRAALGSSRFDVSACERNRQTGDRCGNESGFHTVSISGGPQPVEVTDAGWQDHSNGTYTLTWRYPADQFASDRAPDKFLIQESSFTCQYSVLSNNFETEWSTPVVQDCLGSTWSIRACTHAGECSAGITVDSPLGNPNNVLVPPPPASTNVNPEGGPDDLKPGEWFDSEYAGTGWSFYWASDLRHPEFYSNTYDLVAFWYTYRRLDGIWQPVWFHSTLKANDQSAGSGQPIQDTFSGALYYSEKINGEIVSTEIGQLGVQYDDPNNSISEGNTAARVSGYVNFPGGVSYSFSHSLNHFSVNNILNGPPDNQGSCDNFDDRPENPIDHYRGVYLHNTDISDPLAFDEDFYVLNYIEKNFESMIVTFYDDQGRPIWGRGDTGSALLCSEDNTTAALEDFTIRMVTEGFDPTMTTPADFFDENFVDGNYVSIGQGTRTFTGPRSSEITLALNVNSQFDLDGETVIRTAALNIAAGNPQGQMTKAASLHEIRYEITGDDSFSECTVDPLQGCSVELIWFTDDYYPDGAAYIREVDSTDPATLVQRFDHSGEFNPTQPGMDYNIMQPGQYVFELHRDTTSHEVIAQSKVLAVRTLQAASIEFPEGRHIEPIPTDTGTGNHVGSLDGSFNVDGNGNATYQVSLMSAPASGGYAPNISLVYNSEGSNGIAGVGWGIGGLSAIYRCAQTYEQDGPNADLGVHMDGNDRFCLDGQRLMLDTGTYGADGATYRTEIDQFIRVTSYGTAGTGPQWFKAEYGNGMIKYFGNCQSADCGGQRLDAEIDTKLGDGTLLAWPVSRSVDTSTNYIDCFYDKVGTGLNVEYVVDRMDYTGNLTASTAPTASISFSYEPNLTTERIPRYTGNVLQIKTQRLTQIDVTAGSESLRSYQLTYDSNHDGYGRSVLSQMKACDSPNGRCYPATVFDWASGAQQLPSTTLNADHTFTGEVQTRVGDFNGDGISDLLYHNAGNTRVLRGRLGNGGFVDVDATGLNDSNFSSSRVLDLNLDGYDDVLIGQNAYLSNGPGFDAAVAVNVPNVYTILDINGDALPDAVRTDSSVHFEDDGTISGTANVHIWRNISNDPAATDFFAAEQIIPLEVPDFESDDYAGDAQDDPDVSARPSVIDLDGDGKLEIFVTWSMNYCFEDGHPESDMYPCGTGAFLTTTLWTVYELNETGTQYDIKTTLFNRPQCPANLCDQLDGISGVPVMYDLNADGLTDFLYGEIADNTSQNPDLTWKYQLGTGGYDASGDYAFTEPVEFPQAIQDLINDAEKHTFEDINGDGTLDILYTNSTSDDARWQAKLWRWNGDATFVDYTFASGPLAGKDGDAQAGIRPDATLIQDFNGDGRKDYVVIREDTNDSFEIFTDFGSNENGYSVSQVVDRITNGYNTAIYINYDYLTNPVVYTRENDGPYFGIGNGYVVYDIAAPIPVVSNVQQDAPAWVITNINAAATEVSDFLHSTSFHYEGARIQAGGRGFLGFAKRWEYDPQDNILSVQHNRQDFPYIGRPHFSASWVATSTPWPNAIPAPCLESGCESMIPPAIPTAPAAAPLDPVASASLVNVEYMNFTSTPTVSDSHFVYEDEMAAYRYEPETDQRASYVLTESTYGAFGVMTQKITKAYDIALVSTITVDNTGITNITVVDDWHLGLVDTKTTTYERPNKVTEYVDFTFTYDSLTHLQSSQSFTPRSDSRTKTTAYNRNAFGQVISTTLSGTDIETRTSSQAYDANGRYMISTTNAYGQMTIENLSFDRYGNVLQSKDISGGKEVNAYDSMGRLIFNRSGTDASVNDGTGAWVRTQYVSGSSGSCPSLTAYQVQTTSYSASRQESYLPDQRQCYDKLGRVIRAVSDGFGDTQVIYVDTHYDTSGRTNEISEPHYSTDTSYWTRTLYDEVSRPIVTRQPNGGQVNFTYNGLMTTSNDPRGHNHTEKMNGMGERVEVTDHKGSKIAYDYDSRGRMLSMDGPMPNTVDKIHISYDGFNNRVQVHDPDKGVWRYKSNVLGLEVCQIDAKTQAIVYEYDLLDRMIKRREQAGVLSLNHCDAVLTNSTVGADWTYNNASDQGSSGELTSEVNLDGDFSRSYTHDDIGRVTRVTTNIGSETFNEETTYDQYGRVFQQFDASGDFQGARFVYNDRGYALAVKEAREGTNGVAYRTTEALDARGNVTLSELGFGMHEQTLYSDDMGWLTDRVIQEDGEIQAERYEYDLVGNLIRREDNRGSSTKYEVMTYDELDRLKTVRLTHPGRPDINNRLTHDVQYDDSGNITVMNGVSNTYGQLQLGCTNQPGPHAMTQSFGTTFCYDKNGNQISTSTGRELTYTLFDKAEEIRFGSRISSFKYGSDRSRYQRVDVEDGEQIITHYVGGVEFRTTPSGGRTYHRTVAGVAVVKGELGQPNQQTTYLHRDNLGSLVAVTDSLGQIVNRTSYDPFGRRRSDNDWLVETPDNPVESLTRRGFTDHEHVDDLDLIHMNGRMYDPVLCRFVQADPFIQSPNNTQNTNRYSYVLNNPLRYTDPSGYLVSAGYTSYLRSIGFANDTSLKLAYVPGSGAADLKSRSELTEHNHLKAAVNLLNEGISQGAVVAVPITQIEEKRNPDDFSDEELLEIARTGDLQASVSSAWAVISGAQRFNDAVEDGKETLADVAKFGATFITYGDAVVLIAQGEIGAAFKSAGIETVMIVGGIATGGAVYAAYKSGKGLRKIGKIAKRECFVAGTLVHTEDGLKPIEDIEEGELVAAMDSETGELAFKPVVQLFHNQNKQIFNLTVASGEGQTETLGVTAEHPFNVVGKLWVNASQLLPGDQIKTIGSELLTVVSIVPDKQRQDTYNFEVADHHTYFVGELGAWVHNNCKGRVRKVNGRNPINAKYAGKTFPLEKLPKELRNKYPHSVPFSGAGFPDFSRYSIKNVRIKLGKDRNEDFRLSDEAAGFNKSNPRPDNYTWHHHHDSGYMQLIPTDIHDAVKHTGGVATAKGLKQ